MNNSKQEGSRKIGNLNSFLTNSSDQAALARTREWGIPTTWQVELKKPFAATSAQKGHKGPVKVEHLEGDIVPKKFALTLEKATKLDVHKRGGEKVAPITTKEPTKKKRQQLVKGTAKEVEEAKEILKEIWKESMRSYEA
ncbi:hypothetical protein ACLOJK_017990 [Asimina triloba]